MSSFGSLSFDVSSFGVLLFVELSFGVLSLVVSSFGSLSFDVSSFDVSSLGVSFLGVSSLVVSSLGVSFVDVLSSLVWSNCGNASRISFLKSLVNVKPYPVSPSLLWSVPTAPACRPMISPLSLYIGDPDIPLSK